MDIREAQAAIAARDRKTDWDVQPVALVACHLVEEMGELIHCINRTGGLEEERQAALVDLPGELVDTAWFLLKIANRFGVDLDAGLEDLIRRHTAYPTDPYRAELLSGLHSLDSELDTAKKRIEL